MTLLPGQVQVAGLLMGEGTSYEIRNTFNPWTNNVRADITGDRAWGHGRWSGAEWADETVVPISVTVRGATSDITGWLTAHQALAAAFAAVGTSGDVELRWNLDGGEYVRYGRPRMSEPDPSTIGLGFARTQCAIVCPDPFIYAGTETLFGPVTAPTWSGGFEFPFTLPFEIPSTVVGGEATITNAGTAQTGLVLRITGPCSNPTVSLVTEAGLLSLSLDLTLGTGEFVDIDTTARTILLGGTANRRGDAFGDFFSAPPGDSVIRYRSTDARGSLSGSFRSKWW